MVILISIVLLTILSVVQCADNTLSFTGKILGTGQYAVVKEAMFEDKLVAVKIYSQKDTTTLEEARREFSALQTVNSPFVIRAVMKFANYMVMQHGGKRTLDDIKRPCSLDVFRFLTVSLLSAIDALHAHRIIHGDVKSTNVLVDDQGLVRLADFGFARILPIGVDRIKESNGSALYTPLEVFNRGVKFLSSDIYSAGCTLYEAALNNYPHNAQDILNLMWERVNTPITYGELSPAATQVLSKLLVNDHLKRPTLQQIISSCMLFAQFDYEKFKQDPASMSPLSL